MNPGDTVFMANQPPPNNGPYSKKVIFGFGDVIKKYRETKKYWPDAGEWVNRFDIQPTFVAETDENAFRWDTKLAPYGLRSIPDSNTVKKKLIEWKKKHSTNMEQPQFSFVKKDFDLVGSTKRDDALHRNHRFSKLRKVLKENLHHEFDGYASKVGLPNDRPKKGQGGNLVKYHQYTWMGFYENANDKWDNLQFQIALNPKTKNHGLPPLSAGIWFEGRRRNKKRRSAMIEQLKMEESLPIYITDVEFQDLMDLDWLDRFYKRVFYGV